MPSKKLDDHKSFEELVGRPLSPEEVSEMKFNLVGYVQTLITLDRQQKAWLKQQAKLEVENGKSKGSDTTPEVIN
jgi:hypothetical protein